MDQLKARRKRYLKRKKRVRKNIFGTPDKPRLTVTRSHKSIYCQLVDDVSGQTLVGISSNSKEIKDLFSDKSPTKMELSKATGRLLAEKAKVKGLQKSVFDRNGYKFHGRIKAVADGFKEGEITL